MRKVFLEIEIIKIKMTKVLQGNTDLRGLKRRGVITAALFLLILTVNSVRGGTIQQFLDYMADSEGFPRF
jgi:hypothetical protein